MNGISTLEEEDDLFEELIAFSRIREL